MYHATQTSRRVVVVGGEVGTEVGFTVNIVETRFRAKRQGRSAGAGESVERFEVWERIRAGTGHPARITPPGRFGRNEESRPRWSGNEYERRGAPSPSLEEVSGSGVEVRSTSMPAGRQT